MHHPDYDKPLFVEWYCRRCHLNLHGYLNPNIQELRFRDSTGGSVEEPRKSPYCGK
jgi:hypothetical protein